MRDRGVRKNQSIRVERVMLFTSAVFVIVIIAPGDMFGSATFPCARLHNVSTFCKNQNGTAGEASI